MNENVQSEIKSAQEMMKEDIREEFKQQLTRDWIEKMEKQENQQNAKIERLKSKLVRVVETTDSLQQVILIF